MYGLIAIRIFATYVYSKQNTFFVSARMSVSLCAYVCCVCVHMSVCICLLSFCTCLCLCANVDICTCVSVYLCIIACGTMVRAVIRPCGKYGPNPTPWKWLLRRNLEQVLYSLMLSAINRCTVIRDSGTYSMHKYINACINIYACMHVTCRCICMCMYCIKYTCLLCMCGCVCMYRWIHRGLYILYVCMSMYVMNWDYVYVRVHFINKRHKGAEESTGSAVHTSPQIAWKRERLWKNQPLSAGQRSRIYLLSVSFDQRPSILTTNLCHNESQIFTIQKHRFSISKDIMAKANVDWDMTIYIIG